MAGGLGRAQLGADLAVLAIDFRRPLTLERGPHRGTADDRSTDRQHGRDKRGGQNQGSGTRAGGQGLLLHRHGPCFRDRSCRRWAVAAWRPPWVGIVFSFGFSQHRAKRPVVGADLAFLFGEFRLDLERRELRRAGNPVALEPRVFDLLAFLVLNNERVVSKDELIATVWQGRIVSDSALASCINAARSSVGDDGDRQLLIKTLPRKGVRFVGTLHKDEAGGAPAVATSVSLVLPERPSIAVL